MKLQKYFFLLLVFCFYFGCDNDRKNIETEKIQKDVNEIKRKFDSIQKNSDFVRKNTDSISGMYKIDTVRIDSTLKKINPLK